MTSVSARPRVHTAHASPCMSCMLRLRFVFAGSRMHARDLRAACWSCLHPHAGLVTLSHVCQSACMPSGRPIRLSRPLPCCLLCSHGLGRQDRRVPSQASPHGQVEVVLFSGGPGRPLPWSLESGASGVSNGFGESGTPWADGNVAPSLRANPCTMTCKKCSGRTGCQLDRSCSAADNGTQFPPGRSPSHLPRYHDKKSVRKLIESTRARASQCFVGLLPAAGLRRLAWSFQSRLKWLVGQSLLQLTLPSFTGEDTKDTKNTKAVQEERRWRRGRGGGGQGRHQQQRAGDGGGGGHGGGGGG